MKNSIVNIESVINKSFGTGFVIDSDENGIYILTCKHVLEDVVHPVVEDIVAKVVAKGDFIDMVVLYVSKLSLEALPLQKECCHNLKVEVIGFSNFNKTSLQKEHIDATLYKEHVELHSKEGNAVYKVRKIKALDGFNFERGNSGSPVICKKTKRVIAMISNKEGSCLAYAVNIENLKDVWKDVSIYPCGEKQQKKKIIGKKSINTFESSSNPSFQWKNYVFALLLLVIVFTFFMNNKENSLLMATSDSNFVPLVKKEIDGKWIYPNAEVCIEKGGKVDGNGYCYAEWKKASEICLASKGVLPSLPVLKKIVTDCSGVLVNAQNEKNRINTINCFKEKDFLIHSYWSGTVHNDYYAWAVDFGTRNKYVKFKFKVDDSSSTYVRCEKVGR